MCAVLSHFSHVQLFVTLWTAAHQPPLSMGFSRREYWSGLPCLPPGDLPDPGIEAAPPCLLHCRWFFTTEPPGKPIYYNMLYIFTCLKYFSTDFKNKSQKKGASYLGVAENYNLVQTSHVRNHWQAEWTKERSIIFKKKHYFMEKRGDVARGCFESKSLGEKWEFRVMMLSHWLSC